MIGYMSVADLTGIVRTNLQHIPVSVDLIVGIPRSGMIPAYLVGLFMNRLVVDLETFLANGVAGHGITREVGQPVLSPQAARHILLIDDSLTSGGSMRSSLERVRASAYSGKVTTCVAINHPARRDAVDLFFAEMPQPRIFEWNAFHHPAVSTACFDLDGVLCVDPIDADNDDGIRYREFLRSAQPLFRPTRPLGHIVSARLEKYRALTEEWLVRNGVQYGQLHLIDLPNQAERRRLRAHGSHKARVYRETGASLFYESDLTQAREIAQLSDKPVLCTADMALHLPAQLSVRSGTALMKWHMKRPIGRLKGWWRRQSLAAEQVPPGAQD